MTEHRPSPHAVCEDLRGLVEAWIAAGKPSQAPIEWRRDPWIAQFREHADLLRNLPDRLDRASVAAVCLHAVDSDAAAVQAFISTRTWGFGTVGYGPHRTGRVLIATPDAAPRLRELARVVAESGPDEAYRRMSRDDDLRLKYLGPSFGTKYLHFCQPSDRRPRALILDAFVAGWLRDHCGVNLDPVQWDPATYRRYPRDPRGPRSVPRRQDRALRPCWTRDELTRQTSARSRQCVRRRWFFKRYLDELLMFVAQMPIEVTG